jgi:lysophospholipase L1-like esterase
MIPVLRPVLVAAAAVALVLASDSSSLAGENAAHAAHDARAAHGSSGVDYVALGDSYSAGPLIVPFRADPPGCFRSGNNYPAFLAGYLGVTTYRDVTCSGARVRDFAHRQTTSLGTKAPPQLAELSPGTDLVTVGIGGNDFGLFGSLTGVCADQATKHPHASAPCRAFFTNGHGVNTKFRDATRIRKHAAAGLKEIHAAAPNARVVLVGYPRLLPDRGRCGKAPFAQGDYTFANRVEHLLNRSLKRAAAHHHATFVSTSRVSRGHDICAGKKAWINGATSVLGVALAYHPFLAGERAMARHVFWRLTGHVAPGNIHAAPPPGSVVCNPGTPPLTPTCTQPPAAAVRGSR